MIKFSMNSLWTERRRNGTFPFELQAVTYFSETISAVNFALERLEDWYESAKEKGISRVVMNHGDLSIHHFLYNDAGTGYFTNFERASAGPPQNDLLGFYTKMFRGFPKACPECVEWFYAYTKSFPLREAEVSLFSAIWHIRRPCTRC